MAEKSERSLYRGSPIPEQQQRLAELMRRWWKARDSGNMLPANEQAELEALARVALRASAAAEPGW